MLPTPASLEWEFRVSFEDSVGGYLNFTAAISSSLGLGNQETQHS